MKQNELFLLSDAALREVIDQIRPDQLDLPAPATWSSKPDPTIRSILAGHAFDEAAVPDVLAGMPVEESTEKWSGDLLADDPIRNYDRLNDTATAAASAVTDLDAIVHLSYGDYPVGTYFEHISYYRAFQAWSIAKELGIPFHLSPELVDGMDATVTPQLDELRSYQIFPPAVEVPDDSDAETKLLAKTGFYTE